MAIKMRMKKEVSLVFHWAQMSLTVENKGGTVANKVKS